MLCKFTPQEIFYGHFSNYSEHDCQTHVTTLTAGLIVIPLKNALCIQQMRGNLYQIWAKHIGILSENLKYFWIRSFYGWIGSPIGYLQITLWAKNHGYLIPYYSKSKSNRLQFVKILIYTMLYLSHLFESDINKKFIIRTLQFH